jgi:tetratricopeptide (TPR) repeat protein
MAVHKSMARKTAQAFASAEGYEKLSEVLKAHPNAAAAPDARMKLAMLQAGKKDYAAALENFKLIGASKNASEALKYRAALNTGYVQELQGKNDDAIAAFNGVAQTALIPDEVRFEANYAAGRLLYAKGDFEKAKAALAKATSVRPRSMSEYFWSSQARSLLDRLQAGAPASAPAPAATPAPKTKG